MRVLLADGAHEVRRALRTLLVDDLGMEVVGEVADLRALRAGLWLTRPDLLLVDWELLGSRAGPVLARLSAVYPRLRMIVLSCEPVVQRRALAAGAHAFACKAGPGQLIAALLGIREAGGASDGTGARRLRDQPAR